MRRTVAISPSYLSSAPSRSRRAKMVVALLTATLVFSMAVTQAVLPQKSELLVQGLDEIVPAYGSFDGAMYAGLLPMDNGGHRRGKIMFWLFMPSNPEVSDSLTLWLNGGPGCTSFSAGVLFENSPVTIPHRPAGDCCVSNDEPLVYNRHSWTNTTAMLYIEQPVNVGFSTGNADPVNEDQVSGDVYAFLVNFYTVFPELQSSRLFIFGESYAGMYAPSIARRVLQETQHFRAGRRKGRVDIELAGVGLGNGWVDAKIQGPTTIDYAYWHGMVDQYTREALHAEWEHCMSSGPKEEEPQPFHKFDVPDDCAMMEGVLMAGGAGAWPTQEAGPNTYDVTTWDPYSIIAHGNTTFERFYNDPRVKEALHAPTDIWWRGCIPGAGRRRLGDDRSETGPTRDLLLEQDRPISTIPYLAELLDYGVRVLVYNGDRDLSACVQGSETALNGMNWTGANGWLGAPRGLWTVDDDSVGGYAKEHKGLSFVVIYNSGHLVPFNRPEAALDLITRFIKEESFKDYELPSFDFALHNGTTQSTTTGRPTTRWRHLPFILAGTVSFAAGYVLSISILSMRRRRYDRLSSGDVSLE